MARLRTDRLGLAVTQDGAGSDVLFIGGLADCASAWDGQASALSADFRVTRYDVRGVGNSPTPSGPYRLADLASDAVEVLDAAGIARADVVGSSLGGAVAQRLAVDHPERVRSLTLSGTWARSDRAFRALVLSWIWTAERASTVEELLLTVNRWAYAPETWNSGAVDDAIAKAAIAEIHAGPSGWSRFRDAFTWTAYAALEHDSTDYLPAITVPTLLIVGAADAVLGERYGRQLAELLPDSHLEVVPDAGHRPFAEQPERFNALLTSFLERQEPRVPRAAAVNLL